MNKKPTQWHWRNKDTCSERREVKEVKEANVNRIYHVRVLNA